MKLPVCPINWTSNTLKIVISCIFSMHAHLNCIHTILCPSYWKCHVTYNTVQTFGVKLKYFYLARINWIDQNCLLINLIYPCIMLNIVSNKCFWTFHSLNKKTGLPQKYKACSKPFSAFIIIIIRKASWAANHHVRIISERSCDTEDWSNEENKILPTPHTLIVLNTFSFWRNKIWS